MQNIQKQHCVTGCGCFNHRVHVVTYSCSQLEDSGYERFTLVVQTNCMRLMQILCKQVIPSLRCNFEVHVHLYDSLKDIIMVVGPGVLHVVVR